MKSWLALLFSVLALYADPSLWDYHPLHMGGNFIRVAKADVDHVKPSLPRPFGRLEFRKSNIYATMMVPISQHNIFFPRVELYWVTFDWNKNPKFQETHFHYVQLGLLFYSSAIDRWKWIARLDYNLQTNHLSHPGLYSLYNGILWGSYQVNLKWHYHVGALGYVGMEGMQIYPILGFDFSPDEHWFIQGIFPMTYSIEYKISYFTFALKGRPLAERLRAGSHEPQPRSIFSYSAFGAEFLTRFAYKERLTIEGWGGWMCMSQFYIKDQYGHNAIYFDAKGSPYAGASLDFSW
jgi:hypothetical protein